MADEAQSPLIVKKYGNRRLYDTDASRYITLDELAQMLQGGRDLKVVDAKTGADLTKSVLLQIIAEQEKDRDLLPVAFLKQLVQMGDASMRESLQRYLSLGLDAFLDAQKQIEKSYRDFAGSFFNPMAWMGRADAPQGAQPPMPPQPHQPQQPVSVSPEGAQPAAQPPQAQPPQAQPQAQQPPQAQAEPEAPIQELESTKEELSQLREQMAEMRKMLSKLDAK
jgi:polyhydroxyalkanoate synthesis repressor PhaR